MTSTASSAKGAARRAQRPPGSAQALAWLLLLQLVAAAAGDAASALEAASSSTAGADAAGSPPPPQENTTSSRIPKFSGHSRLQAQKHMQHLAGDMFVDVPERQLIVAQHREDISWLNQVAHIPHIVYQADNSSALRSTLKNMREAAVYLQVCACLLCVCITVLLPACMLLPVS